MMTQKKTEYTDNLSEKIDSLLTEISNNDQKCDDIISHIDGDSHKMDQKESEDLLHAVLSDDVRAEVKVSENGMLVTLDLFPDKERNKPLTTDMVMEKLAELKINEPFDILALDIEIKECNHSGKPKEGITLVRGKRPKEYVPRHIDYAESLNARKNSDPDAPVIDTRDCSPFIIVPEGGLIGHIIEEEPGEEGHDVFGNRIAFPVRRLGMPQIGANITEEGERLSAAIGGRLVVTHEEIAIVDVLQIDKDVDFHTGHVNYPRDVFIKGSVIDGFMVHSGKSIYCERTVNASNVTAEKDLTVKLGIIGHGKSIVKAGGDLKSKFIEHCQVFVNGSMSIGNSILHSQVYCQKGLTFGDKGKIIDSRVMAGNGITVHQIGNEMKAKSSIHVGTDFEIQRRVEWIKTNLKRIDSEIKDIGRVERLQGVLFLDLSEKKAKLAKMKTDLIASARHLVSYVHTNEKAKIIVTGTVFPGVHIEICHQVFEVHQPMHNVFFFLSSDSGDVHWAPNS